MDRVDQSLFSSVTLGAEIDSYLTDLAKENPLAQILLKQEGLNGMIQVTECEHRTRYYYKVESQLGAVWRRYSDFELLSEYMYREHPEILQKMLPPKENFIQVMQSYVVENQDMLRLRKQKFQIFLNHLRESLDSKEEIWVGFLSSTGEFSAILSQKWPNLVAEASFSARIMQFGKKWFKKEGAVNPEYQVTAAKMGQLERITHMIDFIAINLELRQVIPEVYSDHAKIQEQLVKLVKNQEAHQNENSINRLKNLVHKGSQVIELFQSLRAEQKQLESYNQLLNKQLDCCQVSLQELNM